MSFKKSLNTSKGYYNSYFGYVPHKEMQLQFLSLGRLMGISVVLSVLLCSNAGFDSYQVGSLMSLIPHDLRQTGHFGKPFQNCCACFFFDGVFIFLLLFLNNFFLGFLCCFFLLFHFYRFMENKKRTKIFQPTKKKHLTLEPRNSLNTLTLGDIQQKYSSWVEQSRLIEDKLDL